MPERELRKLLEQLREELAKSETLEESIGDQLRAAMSEIESLITSSGKDSEGDGPASSDSLIETLTDAGKRFESSHPTLFEALGRVADTLAKLGI